MINNPILHDPRPNSGLSYRLSANQVVDPVDICLTVRDGVRTEETSGGSSKKLFRN
jgi:hypothetical protein